MPIMELQDFKPVDNADIINRIRYDQDSTYQSRVPEATSANIDEVIETLMSHTPLRNQFLSALLNRIGMVIARNWNWTNPFGKFKQGLLTYGDTVEEIGTGLLQAKVYNDDREAMEKELFGTERPESQSSFHTVNRREYYKITVNQMQLRRAFLEPNGLSKFISQLMQAPTTSDNWDEFTLMTSLFRHNYDNNGFFKVNAPDVASAASGEAESKGLLRSIREYAETLQFISRNYNAARLPIAAQPDELELFVTPQVKAAMDVEALAAAFNIDRADVSTRMTTIPEEYFNIPGAQAILTTKDFFQVYDQVFETTEQWNPVALQTNYFLHHHQIVSLSRFVPSVLFTTDAGAVIEIKTATPTAITDIAVADQNGDTVTTLERGAVHQLSATVTTDPADTNLAVPVRYEVEGAKSDFTRVAQTGVLYVGFDESATSLTVHATATQDSSVTYSESFTLTGDVATLWPLDDSAGDDGEEPEG